MTLEVLTTPTLPAGRHGFFTRKGGASSGIFAGLNCGPGSSDDPGAVAASRDMVAAHMGVGDLRSLNQVHSADVVTVDATPFGERPKADGMVSATPGVGLGVLTADCAPVLFAEEQSGVIGACHAGWKGAFSGILEATVDAMCALGAQRGSIRAVIGPTISQRAYEVGPEFLERFLDEDPDLSRFFSSGRDDRYHFDLPGFVLHRLRAADVGGAEWIGRCTYSDPERFFSYRRTTHAGEADYGRLISVIRL
ncbi:peptidoglycan editing factor PgeF [Oceanibium sediminis]|uniref:peptidoglycan editing factor PgeF n=1 Tax=Oceanibium sediminis TaxID=2026339 RepID=UPI000DD3F8ED|nr:peptidoglycan editing factor PgeF [Oceanibium sediminis]